MRGYKELSMWGRSCKAQLIMMGKSLKEVSEETGLSVNYISAIINERIVVPEETIEKISKCLQVDVPHKAVI